MILNWFTIFFYSKIAKVILLFLFLFQAIGGIIFLIRNESKHLYQCSKIDSSMSLEKFFRIKYLNGKKQVISKI
jgi:hypothetical protein